MMCVQPSRYQTRWNTELTPLFAPWLVLELRCLMFLYVEVKKSRVPLGSVSWKPWPC